MITLEIDQNLIPKNERLKQALIVSIQGEVNVQVRNVPKGTLAVAFVRDEEVKRLNRMYRKKDEVTDVLSWSYFEEDPSVDHLGDVVISYDQAVRQSSEGDVELEVVDLIVHGVLHVLGYDHERPEDAKEMFPLQDSIVEKVL